MDYSTNPLGRKDDGPVTIPVGHTPAHLCMEIGAEFQLELEVVHPHGTQRIQCKARVEGVNAALSKIRILGYRDIIETYRGNKQQVIAQLQQDEQSTNR
jgi:hypothetical protein